jgi:IS4 transposase
MKSLRLKLIKEYKIKIKKIKYYDREHKRTEFLVICLTSEHTIAALYKIRWQIELFKQIKQNFP